jgi:hypothetical protein
MHLNSGRGGATVSQSLLTLTAKREDISGCIRLLEGRRQSPAGPAVRRLIDRLRLKAEWLDARIELELQQSDPVDAFTVEEMPRSSNAA